MARRKIWNRSGSTPKGVDVMTIQVRRTVKDALVWRGEQKLLVRQKGVRVLGVPIGREDYVKNQLAKKNEEHQVLIDRILLVQDLQSAWMWERFSHLVGIASLSSKAQQYTRFLCHSEARG